MDIKIIDKGGVLVLSKGQFPAVDPADGTKYEAGVIYKVKLEDRAFVKGQVEAGAFTLCDDEGQPTTPQGKKIPVQGTPEAIAAAEAAAKTAREAQELADAEAAEAKRLADEAEAAKKAGTATATTTTKK